MRVSILGVSYEFLKGFAAVFVFTSCSLVNISKQCFLRLSDVYILLKYLPGIMMRESSESRVNFVKNFVFEVRTVNSFFGYVFLVLGFLNFVAI